MISFKEFIAENDDHDPFMPRNLKAEEIIQWCEDNAQSYLQRARKNPIFRGFRYELPPLGLINTSAEGFKRVSANTVNLYTIWMDNHPAWSAFPKRSKSLICSNGITAARNYGRGGSGPCLIIPADINKIGICSHEDLWFSFTHMESLFDAQVIPSSNIGGFVRFVLRLMEASGVNKGLLRAAEKDFGALVKCLKATKLETLDALMVDLERRQDHSLTSMQLEDTVDAMSKHGFRDLYELWEEGMDPEKNNFIPTTAGKLSAGSSDAKEIWVQGESAVLSLDFIKSIISDNKDSWNVLIDFLKKYDLHKLDNQHV